MSLDCYNVFIPFSRDFLEQSDVAEIFIAITKVLMVIAQNYHRHFKPHFTNVVDIIVGWHLETEQKWKVKLHCSTVLQSFQHCWENDSKFTLDLLGQLLEDIEACQEKFDGSGGEDDKKLKEFGSFVGELAKNRAINSDSLSVFFLMF